ncbi:MAG: galactokinase, partial [Acidobacteriota bacterium]
GDVPIGAGVSSSAAVAVAFALAWRRVGDLDIADAGVPLLCREMENEYLGVQSGVMDQFASLLGRAGHALFLDCRSLDGERLPVSGDAAVVVFDSGVRRRLSESGFNDRRDECRRAVEILARHLPDIRALRDVDAEAFELYSHHLPPALRRRVRHAVEEMTRVREGADALRRGDLEAFGALMRRSHLSSRDFYEVSIPELDLLAAAAWPRPGCWGARMMGGGFGGCVAALARADAAPAITVAVADAFEAAYGRRPPAFTSALADGAAIL